MTKKQFSGTIAKKGLPIWFKVTNYSKKSFVGHEDSTIKKVPEVGTLYAVSPLDIQKICLQFYKMLRLEIIKPKKPAR